jgi:DNA mismatch repair protein MutL
VVALNVEVPPGEVDFNVHPSKLEVKLLRERAVYSTVQRALRTALAQGDWQMTSWPQQEQPRGLWTAPTSPPREPGLGDWGAAAEMGGWRGEPAQAGGEHHDALEGGERLEDLRIVGQVAHTYLIAEGDAGMYLVDQHAAHERVLLEKLRESLAGRMEQQLLMEPIVVELPADLSVLDEASASEIGRLGFDVESFGPRQLLLRAVPALLAHRQPGKLLGEALTAVARNAHGLVLEPETTWTERLALVLACKTAVRAGDVMSEAEMSALLRQLGEAQLCRTCAHGRPTAILLSIEQLEKEFGRR